MLVVGTCVAVLPVAMVPLWQDVQVPVTCVWSTFVAGRQTVVEWQDSHFTVDVMCVALLPVAEVPLWQVEQPLTMPACENVAGVHATVV